MKLPDAILAKTLGRFDSLIAEGQGILTNASNVPPEMKEDWITGDVRQAGDGYAPGAIRKAVTVAVEWAETFNKIFGAFQQRVLPWINPAKAL